MRRIVSISILWLFALATAADLDAQTPNKALLLTPGGFVQVASTPGLQNPSGITIEGWLYPVENGAVNEVFLGKGDGQNAFSDQSYWLSWSKLQGIPGRTLSFQLFLGSSTWATIAAQNVASNTWTHFATTYDQLSSTLRLFTNGVLAATRTVDAGGNPINSQAIRQSTLPLVFGNQNPVNDPAIAAAGAMDELRIWNRALSATEVAAEYRCGSLLDNSLQGSWTFNGGNANDESGRGNNGFLKSGSTLGEWPGADSIYGTCNKIRPALGTAIVVNGFVVGATLIDGGNGYTKAPKVLISGGGGSGATAIATLDANGSVNGITIITSGSKYTGTPAILIDPPPFPPSQAKGTASLFNGFVTGVDITDTGHGYEGVIPPVTFLGGGGSGARGTAIVINGMVTGINMTASGSGYTHAPYVLIAAPPGLASAEIAVHSVDVTLHLIPGYTYKIQTTTDAGITWVDVELGILAVNATLVRTFDVNASAQLFRVVQVN
jgi:hypothetical protein